MLPFVMRKSHRLPVHASSPTRRSFGIFSKLKKGFSSELEKNTELQDTMNSFSQEKEKNLENAKKKWKNLSQNSKKSSSEISQRFKNVYDSNVKSSANVASEKLKDVYSETKKVYDGSSDSASEAWKKESKKVYENETVSDLQMRWKEGKDLVSRWKNHYFLNSNDDDDVSKKSKEEWKAAWADLFGVNTNKDIDSTLTFRKMQKNKKEDGNGEEGIKEDETAAKDKNAPTSLVAVKATASAWEKIAAQLRDTPIIQGIMDAAKEAARTKTGQRVGQGAKYAKNRIGDAGEDVSEFWETSQNP